MDDYIYHHGIKGMRWGVRRYQNEDGSLTEAGLKKYKRTHDKIDKATLNEKRYSLNAASERRKAAEYEIKRDKVRARKFQTDISIAVGNKMERKRARASMKALKYSERAASLRYRAEKWSRQNERLLSTNASAAVRDSNRAAAEEFVRTH